MNKYQKEQSKKVNVEKDYWSKVMEVGSKLARELNITEEDIQKAIHEVREKSWE